MPISKTEICNFALSHCAVSSAIQDVDTENSPEAAACRLFYNQARDTLLELFPWAFATRRFTLNLLSETYGGWTYAYKYPAVCKRVHHIINPSARTPTLNEKIPFSIENNPVDFGRMILTDQDNAVISYNYNVADENLFSNSFVMSFSYMLASLIAPRLKVKADIQKLTQRAFSVWNSEAAAHNLSEPTHDQERPSEFQVIRG